MDLLIVGLDGLSYNMLDRFDVDFPYLDEVMSEGIHGDLMSVDTPTTIPAWTSFATGKDPGSHGIHSMKRVSRDYQYGPAETNSRDPAIYDFLDDPTSPTQIGCIRTIQSNSRSLKEEATK